MPVVAAVVLATLSACTATSSAVVLHLADGAAVSYQPAPTLHRVLAPRALAPTRFDEFFKNLDYNGGPVMSSNTNYALFWRPKGAAAYPSDYQPGLEQFFSDLAHDSGGHENVDSVATQYNDAAGTVAAYSSHFAGALIDEDPYPANGCTRAPTCLTDEQIRTELAAFVTAHKLPADLAHEYFLLTPPGVESCFEAAGSICSANVTEEAFQVYCAYHGNIALEGGAQLIYANDPYVTEKNCDEPENHPNGKSSDGALIGGLSHEHNESITDPEPNSAWADFAGLEEGSEIGDKCATPEPKTEYGTPLGKAANGANYNQVINGHLYWYQQEWSNQGHQCLQRLTFSGQEPVATFTSAAVKGNEMAFNASGSTAGAGVRYDWQFNDAGHSPSTPVETESLSVTHKFPTTGSFTVALTVFKSDGTSIGAARTIVIGDEGPTSAFNATPASAHVGEAVQFDGSASGDPDGSITSYSWQFGDGSASASGVAPSHTYVAGGTYTATLTITDSSGQTASVTHSIVVSKFAQAVQFTSASPQGATVGGSPYGVSATASSGLAVSVSVETPSVCAISGSTVSFVGAGTCTIDANQAGDANYAAAPQAQQSFAVAAQASLPAPSLPPPEQPTAPPAATSAAFGSLAVTVDERTGAITFTESLPSAGTFSWLLTFQNGRFGAFASTHTKCRAGLLRLGRKCRPARIVFAKGSKVAAAGGTVSFTIKPTKSGLKALRNALKRHKGLPVLAVFTFRAGAGRAVLSHTQALSVRLKKH